MKECSKSLSRRLGDSNFLNKYFCGHGIDIGGKPDPLVLYKEFFPKLESVRTWDLEDGDAQFMVSLDDNSVDFVHSSHCLEHINDPYEGLKNWLRVIKHGGYIVVTLPDEDLYEQGIFPSTFNGDHKNTFSINKTESWSDKSVNILDLIKSLGQMADLRKIELIDYTYRYSLPRYDHTLTPVGESAIEIIIRKREVDEIESKKLIRKNIQPSDEIKIHLNQYTDDMKNMKNSNSSQPPFTNKSDIDN